MTKIKREQLNAAIRDIPLPDNMRELPVSRQGYPVPYFVAKIDGEWDFRVVYPEKRVEAVRKRLCWVCGQNVGRRKAFVSGPMCTITKTTTEPPCHLTCARYAAVACPFLANPRMRRNAVDLPEGHHNPAGTAIMRNPGVTGVLITNDYSTFKDGKGGWLIRMGEPEWMEWYAQRRLATRAEVDESIESGMHLLRAECDKETDPADAHRELDEYVRRNAQWLPLT